MEAEKKIQARKVPAANGWLWIKQGYWLFKKSPVLWVVLTAIGVAGVIGLAMIPVVGEPLATLLFPVLMAGLMAGCRALEMDEELELAHLFHGFKHSTQQLVTLGGINLVCQLLIFGVMMMAGGSELVAILKSGTQIEDQAVLTQAITSAGISLPLGMAMFFVLLMAMQFAPMLVLFDKVAPLAALKISLQAFLRNALPLTVYGLLLLPFAVLASMPMMLGWLILMPVLFTSVYAAYRDFFPIAEDPAAAISSEKATPQDNPPL